MPVQSNLEKEVKDYVIKHGGNKVITSVLIANNGIAAVKCIRSMRKWAYETFGNERAIQFVVMATPEDLKVNAEYIRMADQIVEVPGGRNTNNYANVDLIVEIAERSKVDAVWAGWGHASENPKLPDSLSKTKDNIAFIGPPSGAMRDLGDKIASTLVAQSAQVSCVPWNGSGITVNYATEGIPKDLYKKATVSTVEEAKACLPRIGFPLMIKASEGGGGKGIRKVLKEEELESAFRQVQGEVPGSPIFMMRMLNKCRHLEVQVLGDQYGEAIALYGRDCSVQRRHQKIIEEGHCIIAPEQVWLEMEKAAVRLAKEVGYYGVGTVEYLFEEETSHYYFLELNPRLQVEHPVTELITNVNLPAAQLHVAMGIPLHRIPHIRRFYGQDPKGDSQINFQTAKRAPPKGHVIAARITGENPAEGFKPTSGGIQELSFRSSANVWGYFSVGALGGLHEYADSQFGHIFAHGDTREDTRKELAMAIKEISIRGEISTPVTYLYSLLETEVFKKNQVTTQWLDELIATNAKLEEMLDTWVVVLCGALYRSYQMNQERQKQYVTYLDRGQIPPKDLLRTEDSFELIYLDTKYQLKCMRTGTTSWAVSLRGKEGNSVQVEIRPLGDGGLLILLNGKSHICYGSETVSGMKLMLDSRTCLFTTEYDPTQLRTTTAGKLVRYLVENGSHLKENQPYAEMEVMKMYMPLTTKVPGVITFQKVEGTVLEAGAVIATLKLDDPKQVRRADVYTGDMEVMAPPHVKGDKVHHKLRDAVATVRATLAGYHCADVLKTVEDLFKYVYDPELPIYEFQECLSQLSGRIPSDIEEGVQKIMDNYKNALKKNLAFDGHSVKLVIDTHVATLPEAKRKETLLLVDSLLVLAKKFEKGLAKQAEELISSIVSSYFTVENNYFQRSRDFLIVDLRQQFTNNPLAIYDIELSHFNIVQKNKLILAVMDNILKSDSGVRPFTYLLHDLTTLSGPDHHFVILKAKQILTRFQRPTFEQRSVIMERDLLSGNLETIVDHTASIFDLLCGFFAHPNKKVRESAVLGYVRRAYKAYDVQGFNIQEEKGYTRADWIYRPPAGWRPTGAIPEGTVAPSPVLKRVATDDNLVGLEGSAKSDDRILQRGFLALFESEQAAFDNFDRFLESLKPLINEDFNNIVKIVYSSDTIPDDTTTIAKLYQFILKREEKLRDAFVRRVTVVVTIYGHFPRCYTFRERLGYQEHMVYRHIEPPLAYHLELTRLSNYDVEMWGTDNHQIHLYYAQEKGSKPDSHCCFFARAFIRGDHYSTPNITQLESVINEAENVLGEALNALELAREDPRFQKAWNNHIFMKFVEEISLDNPNEVVPIVTKLAKRYEKRLASLQVSEVELVGHLKGHAVAARFIITNPTTHHFNIDAYAEMKDMKSRQVKLTSLFGSKALEGRDVTESYPIPSKVERKRRIARQNATTYVYDYLSLLDAAVTKGWEKFIQERKGIQRANIPRQLVIAKELVLNAVGVLEETSRPAGSNDVGMVAWRIKLFTPEYPKGRQIILIANDITFQIGSFGVKEDNLFFKASELAREEGLPRIYVAANSGARIGLAEEVRNKFQVEWNDPEHPEKGFKHLFLNKADYEELSKTHSVNAHKVSEDKWLITDIVGKEDSLGVENLRGSGMIAGETSRAYEEIFTLTLVTGRTVGIGAYLVRLGQRTIQNRGPIILTGAPALNKVLGKNVYSSNMQLGGTQIMYTNGVTHLVANDELESVTMIVNWLSYIPCKKGDPVPVLESSDPIDRPIDFVPTKSPYDPRHMLAGVSDNNEWKSGFFDKGSFTETLGGWGKTVVTGRARLGGIPVGVIAVETRTVEHITPADPAVDDSREYVKQQAGQVWFPDSAYKTAQAIQDFNKGEELPLFIFANWRGFSGGMTDLFNEILKFGSYIVDGLRDYKQPIFIYIPPNGELRGGAWVVVDPTINLEQMEMFADENARGGVLEPSGICEIKYKSSNVVATMHRLDSKLKDYDVKLDRKDLTEEVCTELRAAVAKRENDLMSIYNQVATTFADLHDTPGRMKAKGVIKEVLPWKTSRKYFYYRLKRRLQEEYLKRKLIQLNPQTSRQQAADSIQERLKASTQEAIWNDDKAVAEWLEKEQEAIQQGLRKSFVTQQVAQLAKEDTAAAVDALLQVLGSLSPEQKKTLLSTHAEKLRLLTQ